MTIPFHAEDLEYALWGDEFFDVQGERQDDGTFQIHIVHWRGLDITSRLRSNEVEDLARALYSIYSEPEPEPPPRPEGEVSLDWLGAC